MQRAKTATLSELFVWLGIYIAVLIGAVAIALLTPVPAPWRSLVALIPLLPGAAIVRWEMRAFAQLDEMQLRNQIVALAWTFAVTGVLMVAYALLEAVGWPRLPMAAIFTTMIAIRIACSWTQWLRYR